MFHISLRILLGGGEQLWHCGWDSEKSSHEWQPRQKMTREGSPGRSAEVENLCPPPGREVNLNVWHLWLSAGLRLLVDKLWLWRHFMLGMNAPQWCEAISLSLLQRVIEACKGESHFLSSILGWETAADFRHCDASSPGNPRSFPSLLVLRRKAYITVDS